MKSTLMFSSKGNTFHTFASGIRFQYIVNYTIHTCNINNNRATELSTSELYDILFDVKEIWYVLEMLSL